MASILKLIEEYKSNRFIATESKIYWAVSISKEPEKYQHRWAPHFRIKPITNTGLNLDKKINLAKYIRHSLEALIIINNCSVAEAKLILETWVLNWGANRAYFNPLNETKEVQEIIDNISNSCKKKEICGDYNFRDLYHFLEMGFNKNLFYNGSEHWFNEEIELLSRKFRYKIKNSLKNEWRFNFFRSRIKDHSDQYKKSNFDILPTNKHLRIRTGYSPERIRTYGIGLFIEPKENKNEIIRAFRSKNSRATQIECHKITGISIGSIKRYWNS